MKIQVEVCEGYIYGVASYPDPFEKLEKRIFRMGLGMRLVYESGNGMEPKKKLEWNRKRNWMQELQKWILKAGTESRY